MTTPDGKEPEGEPKVTPDPVAAPDPTKGFTQADLDRASAAARRETEAKFTDHEGLVAKAAELADLKTAQLSDAEKQVERADAATKRADAADERVLVIAITADIQTKAAMKGIDPEIAVAMIDRTGIEHKEGAVTGTDSALDALLELKPFLKVTALVAPNLNPGGSNAGEAPVKMTDAERDMAHKLNKTGKDGKRLTPAESEAEYMAGKR